MTAARLIALLATVALVAVGVGDPDRLGLGGASRAPEGAGVTLAATVDRVVDGDTVRVRLDGRRDTVRLIGIDTPESVKPDSPVECFGPDAARQASRLLDGERVRLVLDREPRDRFGRLLAYVHRKRDDVLVNARLVADGYATTLEIPPNTRLAGRFADLERTARREGRGLWGRCR